MVPVLHPTVYRAASDRWRSWAGVTSTSDEWTLLANQATTLALFVPTTPVPLCGKTNCRRKIKVASKHCTQDASSSSNRLALHVPPVAPFSTPSSDDRSPKVPKSMADIPESASIQNLPQELYDNISGHLSDFDARNAAEAIENYRMDDTDGSEEIFRDSRWASAVESQGMKPVLLGWGLSRLHYGQQAAPGNPISIALCILDTPPSNQIDEGMFFASLRRPYTFDRDSCEVRFAESRIILNVENVFDAGPYVKLQPGGPLTPNPNRHSVLSYYIHWSDSDPGLHPITSRAITRPRFSILGTQPMVCGISIDYTEHHSYAITFGRP
ncbi:MAG: hypothetical protein Q9226_006452 [Calogaya cf. arnoldii]